jgi:hypothetical protein
LIINFLDHACGIAYLVLVPICLAGWLIRPWRAAFGLILYIATFCIGLDLWAQSFVTVLHLWGVFFTILGVLLAGIGIVPMAILATLFHANWAMLMYLVINIFIIYISRFAAAAMWESVPSQKKPLVIEGSDNVA